MRAIGRRVKVQGDLFHGRVPAGAVYIGRSAPGLRASPYANPYPVKVHGLAESRRLYREHLAAHPELVEAAARDLAGRDYACWCPEDQECHGDDLADAINQMIPAESAGVAWRGRPARGRSRQPELEFGYWPGEG
jgi:Domain of unknown function (DUF4326)